MKVCLGIIINSLNDQVTLIDFLINAKRYGHLIDEVIIVYSQDIDTGYLELIYRFTSVRLVNVHYLDEMRQALLKRRVAPQIIEAFLDMSDYEKTGLITYSKKRNLVLIQAMLDKEDVVFFIDSDVHPCVLYQVNCSEEVDFIGEHLKQLNKDQVAVTTSDYSGYFILPPMDFEGMDAFLKGIQKEKTIPYLKSSALHKCLKLGMPHDRRQIEETFKMLGGNAAIKLSYIDQIPPFFSYYYKVRDTYYLTRGEDTMMGLYFEESPLKMMDIDLKILHDTYGSYPTEPNLKWDEKIRTRLFYASMGWIGRNPFLNYKMGKDYVQLAQSQKEELTIGAPLLAKYLSDERFLLLPEAVDEAVKQLHTMIQREKQVEASWLTLTKQLKGV